MGKTVHVAVGVVLSEGKILIARRPLSAHQGGLWEFPGGKVAESESVRQALQRELREELAIHIETTEALLKICHDYGDKQVLLDVHKVTAFSGEPRGAEGQPIRWVSPAELIHYPFPAANRAIVNTLTLPDKLLITGEADSLEEYLQKTGKALRENQLRLVQLRCPNLSANSYAALAKEMHALCCQYNAKLIANTSTENFASLKLDGLHLNRHELFKHSARPVDLSFLLGASCHTAEEIEQARKINVDYLTFSPVAATPSHPGVAGIGWQRFAELARTAGVPVYALGGLNEANLAQARGHGAQGIAAIRCWWE